MKVRIVGVVMGALLTIAGAQFAEAADCRCISSHRGDGLAYAQSWFDYRSSSRVTESFGYDDGFRPAPQDARLPSLPPASYSPPLVEGSYDDNAFSGGVGYGAAADGAGYGGVVTYANGGDRNLPPNSGGVNLPPGYGPTYRGGWQGPPVPARGGLGIRTK